MAKKSIVRFYGQQLTAAEIDAVVDDLGEWLYDVIEKKLENAG